MAYTSQKNEFDDYDDNDDDDDENNDDEDDDKLVFRETNEQKKPK